MTNGSISFYVTEYNSFPNIGDILSILSGHILLNSHFPDYRTPNVLVVGINILRRSFYYALFVSARQLQPRPENPLSYPSHAF